MPCQFCAEGHAPNCAAKPPAGIPVFVNDMINVAPWVICTRPSGHEGDHVYCGGDADLETRPDMHAMFRWKR